MENIKQQQDYDALTCFRPFGNRLQFHIHIENLQLKMKVILLHYSFGLTREATKIKQVTKKKIHSPISVL